MEKDKFVKFVTDNIGKEVVVNGHVGMLIGYKRNTRLAIISFTKSIFDNKNSFYTWSADLLESSYENVILIHTPLTISCYYLAKCNIKFLDNYESIT